QEEGEQEGGAPQGDDARAEQRGTPTHVARGARHTVLSDSLAAGSRGRQACRARSVHGMRTAPGAHRPARTARAGTGAAAGCTALAPVARRAHAFAAPTPR